jgi:hypothetical protein
LFVAFSELRSLKKKNTYFKYKSAFKQRKMYNKEAATNTKNGTANMRISTLKPSILKAQK